MDVMKKMVVCLVAVISVSGLAGPAQNRVGQADKSQSVARGAPIVVFEGPVHEFQTVHAKFDIDSKLGRAWIDVENVDSEFEVTSSVENRNVEGLSYNPEAKEVIYQQGDSSIVCADASSFLGMITLHPTGNCPLVVSYEERTVDDGTRPSTETFAKVTLNLQGPAQASQR